MDPSASTTAVANNATNTGSSAVNSFDPTASQNNFLSSYNNLNATQQQGSQNYEQQYAQAVASNPTVSQLYQQGNAQYNVPGLMSNANQLNNAVLQDPQQNVNAAKGFNYDSNQVGQQTTQDLARLDPLAQAATNSAQNAQTLAGQYVAAGQAQNAQNLLPIQSQQQFALQQQANQAQAYITANQSTMDALTAKMNAGVQLSATEMSQYNQLIQAQASVQAAQIGANATTQAAQITGNAAQNVQTQKNNFIQSAQNATVYNPTTGQVVNPTTGQVTALQS